MSANVRDRWSTDQLITGIETDQWLKLLKGVGFDVSPTYLHRAAWVTGWSLPATLLGRIEDARFARQLASLDLKPPIFVLGHWRSGTTHLHNLLGRVPGHTYPTVYQVVFPTAFLSTDPIVPSLTARLLPATRTYDAVRHGWNEAAEDEIALAKLTGLSPYLAFMFPEHAARYERYVDFLQATPDERERWVESLRWFLKKVSLAAGGDRVVVKSCTHTARVRLLLEAFPEARFVYIHRHPYEVYASTLHMRSHTDWENFFHLPEGDVDTLRKQQTLALGQRLFEQWVEDRRLIPENRLFEIGYDELAGNELAHLASLWSRLELPDWVAAEPVLRRYLETLHGYRRNQLSLPTAERDRVYAAWQCAFDTYHYPREHTF